METGNIVEYIDNQKIISSVISEVKKQRVRVLTENNREVKLPMTRLIHLSSATMDMSMSRDAIVSELKTISQKRRRLAQEVPVEELWEVLCEEGEWVELPVLTGMCFPENPSPDHASAVMRALFANRLYFRFDHNRFFPNSMEHVENAVLQQKEQEEKARCIDNAARWITDIRNGKGNRDTEFAGQVFSWDKPLKGNPFPQTRTEIIQVLGSLYLMGKESPHHEIGKEIIKQAGLRSEDEIFDIMVNLRVWNSDENVELLQYQFPVEFPEKVILETDDMISPKGHLLCAQSRRDLRDLDILTIDGQGTLDFDDALSIEFLENGYRLGIHISDVSANIHKGTELDREALTRGSSIYMPDKRIPMLPKSLAEDFLSLKKDEDRPAVSTMITLSGKLEIEEYEIIPSLIRVKHQYTYTDVNGLCESDPGMKKMYEIGQDFRKKRLEKGAVQITLPEINLWFTEEGELVLTRTNRESPARILVSELMIMANWVMSRFLCDHKLPAVFRSQPGPKVRLFDNEEGSLFQNWMQRKHLNRFVLLPHPERHHGLGLDSYVTATSPIRKYVDLVTQRQIRAGLGLETPYTEEDIREILIRLEWPMGCVGRIQMRRKRYWILKYLEKQVGKKEVAMVLNRRKNAYQALIPEYMLECSLPLPANMHLKPEDLVQVTIQHINPRKDIVNVFVN